MVKRKGNLISSLCRMDNILLADTNARKAKRRSRRFIEKHDKNIIDLIYIRQRKFVKGIEE